MSTRKVISAQLVADAENQIHRRANQVNYDTQDFTVAYLATNFLIGDESVSKIYTNNQDLVWDNDRQSRLIESMLLGLPIAVFFVMQEPGGRIEIVDGSQRLKTIVSFVRDELRLSGLQNLSYLNGFLFSNLVASRQQKFGNIPVRTIVLPSNTLESVKKDIIDRYNTSNNFEMLPIKQIRDSITVTS